MIIRDKDVLGDFIIDIKFKKYEVYEEGEKKTHHITVQNLQDGLAYIAEQHIVRSDREVSLAEFFEVVNSIHTAMTGKTKT
jgi:hypothetical protein